MLKSIKWRLATIYVILVVIVMIMSGSLIVWMTSSSQEESMRDELISVADYITQGVDEAESSSEISETIKELIYVNRQLLTDKLVYLLDEEGRVLYPVVDQGSQDRFYTAQVMGALYGNTSNILDNVTIKGYDDAFFGYASPVNKDEKVIYVVYVLVSTQSLQVQLKNTVGVIVLAILLAIVIAGILGIIFSNFLTKPISVLSEKARAMAGGNLELSVTAVSDDEIGDLSRNFNTMAVSLKDTLDQISSEKNKLEIVFSHMTDGILVFDRLGMLTNYNPASVQMLDITNQMTFQDIFSPFTKEKFKDIYQEVLKNSLQLIIKVRGRYYNACFAKFISQHETLVGIICVLQDITEHKKLEEMQKEFVANVSHELRTPLTTIKSYTETLLDGALYETEIAENFLNVINHEADRMTALVQDLLDLSKLDNKQTNMTMETLNLNLLLEDSLEKFKLNIYKKEQKLIYHPADRNYIVMGDVNRIEQVFKNIISNAMKYSPEETTIEVGIFAHDPYVIVEVQDSGVGIPEDDLPRIFERFYRVDKARSREMGGTGLGLAIAKEIMEYHGGHIEVKSRLNEGSTFSLYFPI